MTDEPAADGDGVQRRRGQSLFGGLVAGSVVALATAAAAVAVLALHKPPVTTGAAVNPSPSAQVARPAVTPATVPSPEGSPTPVPTITPTPVPPTTRLTLSGALSGDLHSVRSICGRHDIVPNGGVNGTTFDSPYVYATGTLPDGHAVLVQVNDPKGAPEWDGGWILIDETLSGAAPANPYTADGFRTYADWDLSTPTGISAFDVNRGATLHAVIPGWHGTPGSVLLAGTIICP